MEICRSVYLYLGSLKYMEAGSTWKLEVLEVLHNISSIMMRTALLIIVLSSGFGCRESRLGQRAPVKVCTSWHV